jgi:hypothetical protein
MDKNLAPQVGFEPTTLRLTADPFEKHYSVISLLCHSQFKTNPYKIVLRRLAGPHEPAERLPAAGDSLPNRMDVTDGMAQESSWQRLAEELESIKTVVPLRADWYAYVGSEEFGIWLLRPNGPPTDEMRARFCLVAARAVEKLLIPPIPVPQARQHCPHWTEYCKVEEELAGLAGRVLDLSDAVPYGLGIVDADAVDPCTRAFLEVLRLESQAFRIRSNGTETIKGEAYPTVGGSIEDLCGGAAAYCRRQARDEIGKRLEQPTPIYPVSSQARALADQPLTSLSIEQEDAALKHVLDILQRQPGWDRVQERLCQMNKRLSGRIAQLTTAESNQREALRLFTFQALVYLDLVSNRETADAFCKVLPLMVRRVYWCCVGALPQAVGDPSQKIQRFERRIEFRVWRWKARAYQRAQQLADNIEMPTHERAAKLPPDLGRDGSQSQGSCASLGDPRAVAEVELKQALSALQSSHDYRTYVPALCSFASALFDGEASELLAGKTHDPDQVQVRIKAELAQRIIESILPDKSLEAAKADIPDFDREKTTPHEVNESGIWLPSDEDGEERRAAPMAVQVLYAHHGLWERYAPELVRFHLRQPSANQFVRSALQQALSRRTIHWLGLPIQRLESLDTDPPKPDRSDTSAVAESTVSPSLPRLMGSSDPITGSPPRRFRRSGEVWEASFDAQFCHVSDSKGIRYIVELLRASGRSLDCLTLLCAAAGEQHKPALGSAGEALTPTAVAEYQSRIEDLEERIAEAERFNDEAQKQLAQAEMNQLVEQISSAHGLGGRPRKDQDDAERVRKSVSNAISRAIQSIRRHHPELADHLQVHIKCGYFICYTPDEVPWEF